MNANDWNVFKQKKCLIKHSKAGSDKTFKGYGEKDKLTVLGTFVANIQVRKKQVDDTFYVIQEGKSSLLGDITAMKLNVLHIQNDPNILDSSFPCIKDITVHINIDKAIQPINQPLRRTSLAFESLIEEEIRNLLRQDIIESVFTLVISDSSDSEVKE